MYPFSISWSLIPCIFKIQENNWGKSKLRLKARKSYKFGSYSWINVENKKCIWIWKKECIWILFLRGSRAGLCSYHSVTIFNIRESCEYFRYYLHHNTGLLVTDANMIELHHVCLVEKICIFEIFFTIFADISLWFVIIWWFSACHAAICNKDSKVYTVLDTMGLIPKPQHRKIMAMFLIWCVDLCLVVIIGIDLLILTRLSNSPCQRPW